MANTCPDQKHCVMAYSIPTGFQGISFGMRAAQPASAAREQTLVTWQSPGGNHIARPPPATPQSL